MRSTGWRARWVGILAVSGALAACALSQGGPAEGSVGGVVLVMVAHPDDWQLFLGDVVVEALGRGDRVVAVVASAGGDDRPEAFWRAREAGALASMGAALALARVSTPSGLVKCRAVALAGPRHGSGTAPVVCDHPVGRMATVFLRLPDGRGDGSGFARTGGQSLLRLEQGKIRRIDPVDGGGAYGSTGMVADAVVGVLGELGVASGGIAEFNGAEPMGRGRVVRVLTHDPEVRFNPLDHADHRVVGRVALAVAARVGAAATVYAGYSNVRRPDNLGAERGAWKSWLFVAYDRAMLAANGRWSAYAENAWAHASYLGRTYGRVLGALGTRRSFSMAIQASERRMTPSQPQPMQKLRRKRGPNAFQIPCRSSA